MLKLIGFRFGPFDFSSFRPNKSSVFLVFPHVMRQPCWCAQQWQNVDQILPNNKSKVPQKTFFRFNLVPRVLSLLREAEKGPWERACFRLCSVHQHGRRDVT